MDVQFDKAVIPCLHNILYDVRDQEKSQEVKLTEEMPDIGRVIMSWGQILLRGKEWRSGSVGMNCGVMAWVLYEPEEGGTPRCVEVWIPFQTSWDIESSDQDGFVTFAPLLRAVEARSVSARKLVVRVAVSIHAAATVPGEATVMTPSGMPEDVHMLKEDYLITIPRESGEKAFSLEESFELPPDMPKLEKTVSYCVQPTVSEQKIMGDKLILRGTADLHLVYICPEGNLHSWDFSMPFSQYTQLEEDYSGDAEALIVPVITALELDRGEDQKLMWKVGISGQYTVYDRTVVSVVADAYSTHRQLTTRVETLNLPSVLCRETVVLNPEQIMDFDGVRLADAAFYPEHPKIYKEEDGVQIGLGGTFRLVGYDSTGQLCSSVKRWEQTHSVGVDRTVRQLAQVVPGGKVNALFTGNGTDLRCQLPLMLMSVSGQGIPMLTEMSIGEVKERDSARPALIIKRTGNSTLWEHAKTCGSTVEAIQNANGLQEDPSADRMLLIPIE